MNWNTRHNTTSKSSLRMGRELKWKKRYLHYRLFINYPHMGMWIEKWYTMEYVDRNPNHALMGVWIGMFVIIPLPNNRSPWSGNWNENASVAYCVITNHILYGYVNWKTMDVLSRIPSSNLYFMQVYEVKENSETAWFK